MALTYSFQQDIPVHQIIDVLDSSTIQRPTHDATRIEHMFQAADLVVSCWDGDLLAGIARSLTDFCYCCYLSDLAVRQDYQHQGIGKRLVQLTREKIGPETMLLLLAAPSAVDYYPKIGMQSMDRAYYFPRKH